VQPPEPLPELQGQVENLGQNDLRPTETGILYLLRQARYETSDFYQTRFQSSYFSGVAIDSRQVRMLNFGDDTDMPVFQYIDPAVQDEMFRIYRDYNLGMTPEIVHNGAFKPIERMIHSLSWQSDYWSLNGGEALQANFSFVNSMDHFWRFQSYQGANDDFLNPECEGGEICLSNKTFAEELAQADHFEVERDMLLGQLVGLSETFMEEISVAA
jgi:hypothetical protein